MFVTDVATYVQAFQDFLPNKIDNYCNGCQQNYDYCAGNLDAQQEGGDDQAAEEGDGNGGEEGGGDQNNGEQEGDEEGDGEENGEGEDGDGERRLSKRRKLANNRVYEQIDCDQCEAYGCWDDDQGDDGYTVEDALEWLEGLSQCQQSRLSMGNFMLYEGLMCNSNADGVEIGMFLDEECTLYSTNVPFQSLEDYRDDYQYAQLSKMS